MRGPASQGLSRVGTLGIGKTREISTPSAVQLAQAAAEWIETVAPANVLVFSSERQREPEGRPSAIVCCNTLLGSAAASSVFDS